MFVEGELNAGYIVEIEDFPVSVVSRTLLKAVVDRLELSDHCFALCPLCEDSALLAVICGCHLYEKLVIRYSEFGLESLFDGGMRAPMEYLAIRGL